MVGKRLSHYRILEQIGAGGMGEVYRAHDEQLDRTVAIKVLLGSSIGDDMARARLLREARAAAALNHPHICTIHEVGDSDGQGYIVMELVDGEPLSHRVARGPLPPDQVVRYGVQLADALAHAHERGVIHRDLKSANVIITTDGRPKMLDFGLAKRFSQMELSNVPTQSQTFLTKPGALVGTIAYMAPEQLRGQAADARSDIWSLGVTLYEMAAGVQPFPGQTAFEVSSAILNDLHRPHPPQLPASLRSVIDRCLAKDPALRYQRADEVRAALESAPAGVISPWATPRYGLTRLRRLIPAVAAVVLVGVVTVLNFDWLSTRWSGASTPRIQSLAVLPLENLSGDPTQEYFADGMTDALITDLAHLGGLKRVVARSSVMRFKRTDKPLPDIARELRVDALITGAVVRVGDRVRITAQLIDPKSEGQLWADGYERNLRDVLTLQSEVARAIAQQIKVNLSPEDHARLASARQVDPEVYDAFLKGRFHWFKISPEGFQSALDYFQLALEKDPNYAPAYAGVSMTWLGRAHMGLLPHNEVLAKSKTAALKAVELDETLAEGHLALAYTRSLLEWDWSGADSEFQRTINLNPNLPDARIGYADVLLVIGHREAALREIEQSLQLDPLNSWTQIACGGRLLRFGRHDDGIALLRKALATDPNAALAHRYLWTAFHQKRMHKVAVAEAKTFLALIGHGDVAETLAHDYVDRGYSVAMKLAAEKLAARSRRTYVQPTEIARLYAYGGDKDRALDWLETAHDVHDTWLIFLGDDPRFESLRNESRFQNLLRRMNISE